MFIVAGSALWHQSAARAQPSILAIDGADTITCTAPVDCGSAGCTICASYFGDAACFPDGYDGSLRCCQEPSDCQLGLTWATSAECVSIGDGKNVCVYGTNGFCSTDGGSLSDHVITCLTRRDGSSALTYDSGDCDGDGLANSEDFEPCVKAILDGGAVTRDASTVPVDGGPSSLDAGDTPSDGGEPPEDASIDRRDAEPPETQDGGTEPVVEDASSPTEPKEKEPTRPGAAFEFRGKGGSSCSLSQVPQTGSPAPGFVWLLGAFLLLRRRT
jgi:MYXO-CTERM domain-containing protein